MWSPNAGARSATGRGRSCCLGQNVDDYRDPAGKGGFAALVRQVQQIPGLKRLRFLTSHPQDLEDELLEVMASSDVVCRELQLPVQSGDDTILKRMARGYQVRHYRAIVERARSLMPDIGLATDVIVGFPGESEAAFLNTRALLEEIEFDVVHLAMYSPRPGTFAATRMADDVPDSETSSAGSTICWRCSGDRHDARPLAGSAAMSKS